MERSWSYSVQCVRHGEEVVYRTPSGLNALLALEELRKLCDESNIWTRKQGDVLHFRLAHEEAQGRVEFSYGTDESERREGISFEVSGHTDDLAQLHELATESYARASDRKGPLDHLRSIGT